MFFQNSITSSHITQWTQQLASLLSAHLSLLQALELLSQSQTHKKLKTLTQSIHRFILDGNSLSSILKEYPALFDKTYCQLIYSAEQSGALASILQKIAESRIVRQQVNHQLIKTFIYPSLVLCVGITVFVLLLVWIVPQLAQVFNQFQQNLPWFTQWVLKIADLFQHFGLYFFITGTVLFCIVYLLNHHVPKAELYFARSKWQFPFLSILLQNSACIIFSRTLSILLNAGIPIINSLTVTLQVINNSYAQQRLRLAVLLIHEGHSFSYAMQYTQLFPALALQMWQIGEHTGQLVTLLNSCAIYYQQQFDNFIQHLMQLIEPVLLIVLGILIGSVVIAMYLPLFQIGLVMGP